jgi:hypothetical protein
LVADCKWAGAGAAVINVTATLLTDKGLAPLSGMEQAVPASFAEYPAAAHSIEQAYAFAVFQLVMH